MSILWIGVRVLRKLLGVRSGFVVLSLDDNFVAFVRFVTAGRCCLGESLDFVNTNLGQLHPSLIRQRVRETLN